MQILLVEDDLLFAEGMKQALKQEGNVVNHLHKGQDAICIVEDFSPDIVILDFNLPDIDGLVVLTHLRKEKITLPILVLTAGNSVQEMVSALDNGADDSLAKPFEMAELLARTRVLERRISSSDKSNTITIGLVSLDVMNMQVKINGQAIILSKCEFMLLKSLMQNVGKVQTRENLQAKFQRWDDDVISNALDVHIHHLRKKIGSDFIKTIHGVGYTVDKS